MEIREKRGICGLCSVGCWIVATYDDGGRITGIRPDEGTPMGILCRIGERAPEVLYSENRLRTPLRRVGPKGSFDFEPFSWEEAYDLIVEKLNRARADHGPENVAIYTGVGSFEQAHCDVYQPKGVAVSSTNSVLFPFGSPNTMGVGALCYVAYGMMAPHLTLGRMFMNMFSDVENSELIVVWGTNPATDLPPVDMNRILEARGRGADVVVIDPRRTATVKFSEGQWVPIRPGTDGALALGLCYVLIEEELHDEEFARNWTVGFEDFARYVQHFRPEVVERITTVPAATTVDLARRIAGARGVSQLMYTGLEYASSGVQNIRATLVLWALAGQLDVPGGLCFSMRGNSFPINRTGHQPNPDIGPRLGRDRFPLYIEYRDEAHAIALPESVLEGKPYRIGSLIVMGSSILTSWPNPTLWRETLGGLDFLVSIDRQLTADAAYADVVLPATTHFETESYMTYGSVFRIRERMIEPVGEARPDLRILAELADRLGYGHLYPQTSEALLRHVLKGSGFTLEQVREAGGAVSVDTEIMQYRKWTKGLLREDGLPGFETPSGKLEIASAVLSEFGYDPLPVYAEPSEGPLSRPDLAQRFPLVFDSGSRASTSFHSQHIWMQGPDHARPEPAVTMNTKDAGERSIGNGDRVRIRTPRGSVVMRARVTDDIMRGVVDANHAGGGPCQPPAWREANVNELTDLENVDPISGFPVYKSLLCEVEREEEGGDALPLGSGETTVSDFAHPSDAKERRTVYMDHNATTPPSPEVIEAIGRALKTHGNPSSIHGAGREARRAMDEARRKVAQALGCTARRIIFTGSGSEANNLALKGAVFAAKEGGGHVIATAIEHPSVSKTVSWLEERGVDVTVLPVDGSGTVSPSDFEGAITDRTLIASVMLANNETGVIQPVSELAKIARGRGVLFHTDAVQALGKIPVDVKELGADLVSFAAHKAYGPKGVGALFMRKGTPLESLTHGGGQEHGIRAATENLTGIAGFAAACEGVPKALERMEKTRRLRDLLEEAILAAAPGARILGRDRPRLPNTACVTLPGTRGESLVLEMDRRGIALSSGSACKSGSSDPSASLVAMGLSEEEAHCTVRFSLGVSTTEEDVEFAVEVLKEILAESRNIIRFISCK
ncbi:MAG: IscS subfamily cysteine desulfurase [Planctomycetota bacterium]|jgi:cysteine sulfinate desulfinase/cysteine desulfurase-like protein/anaerobic selenocysteine-containing dehydrogenase